MAYESLAKVFYKNPSPDRFAENNQLAEERRNADSTYLTGLSSASGEFFLAMPREITTRVAEILLREREIESMIGATVGMERGALMRSLIIDEVVSTNGIEGVYSTRKQIGALLESQEVSDKPSSRRFRELARLYLELDRETPEPPKTLPEIRRIYDRVMDSEPLDKGDRPDGILFRREEVTVHRPDGKTIHSGLYPESAINHALEQMISVTVSPEVPPLLGAIMGHFIFEYTHPFYDGNGRTGRYLLALWLRRSLTTYTVLSLSRVIAENKGRYYRAFTDVEQPLNHGELTFFAMELLDDMARAQDQLVQNYNERRLSLAKGFEATPGLQKEYGLSTKEMASLMLVFQYVLFAQLDAVSLDDLVLHADAGKQTIRKHMARLEQAGLVHAVTKRPLRFGLTSLAREKLGLEWQ